MIKNITIKNFQSHKDTEIGFLEQGVNVICGSSDQGKTAVLRAFLWLANNRPLGVEQLSSHWARDGKGKIKDAMSVNIETDKGIILRNRDVDNNEYVLVENGIEKKYETVNKDVPQDIKDFLNIEGVNLQLQHDAPFLLSQTASETAKFFNKIARLDIIDKVLAKAESKRREFTKDVKETLLRKEQLEKEAESFQWLGKAHYLLSLRKNIDDKLGQFQKAYLQLEKQIKEYEALQDFTSKFVFINRAKDIVQEIEKLDNKTIEIKKEKIKVAEQINNYKKQKKMNVYAFDKKRADTLIKEISEIVINYKEAEELEEQIARFMKNKNCYQEEHGFIEKQKKSLPDVCPICGQVFDKGVL